MFVSAVSSLSVLVKVSSKSASISATVFTLHAKLGDREIEAEIVRFRKSQKN